MFQVTNSTGYSQDLCLTGHHWFQHKSYVHHSHITVKMVGVFVAVGLIVVSILDIFGIARDSEDAKPFHYVHNVWNLFFGVLMIFMDAPARWLGKGAAWQTALWHKAPSLGKARTESTKSTEPTELAWKIAE